MKARLIILILTVSISGLGQTINGKVFDYEKEQPVSFIHVQLIDHFSKNIIDKTSSDFNGVFKFEKVKLSLLDIRINMLDYIDTTFENILVMKDTSMTFNTRARCSYESSKKNKTCPVCHQSDQA